ncbi:hypothetical protein RFH42_08985 [Acinetobacter rudis]|uniref:hypothetical protein n=1 Tax=Acinetobacter rudis TaxID=632955 RepID=UPI00280DE9CB|nr:hypothetical protein [Acinetobacter rudis]MDQ8953093.1 hypothetical protein [Acinetobacter rudis]
MSFKKYSLVIAGLFVANSTFAAAPISGQQMKTLQKQLRGNILYLSNQQGSCLLSDQSISSAITVVYADPNKKNVFHYRLVEALPLAKSNDCIETLGTDGLEGKFFYRVDEKSRDFIRGYGFELGHKQLIYKQRQIIGINLFAKESPQRITECSSSEGKHFNIWQSNGKKLEKLLHRYTYLNMDLESNCKDADYQPGLLNLDEY